MSGDRGSRVLELDGAPAVPGLVFRHFERDRDYPAVASVLSVANLHDRVDWLPTEAALRHDWELTDGADLDEDVLIVEIDGAMVGFVDHSWKQRGQQVMHHLNPLVLPSHRHRGIGRVLLAWAEARVGRGLAARTMGNADIPHVVVGWADLEIPEVAPFAAATGYAVDGYVIMMTRSLADPIPDAPLPPGLEIRPVRAEDHRRIWDADCEAFQDHREPTVRSEADFQRWFSQPDLDTARWLVAWDGDEVAGSVMSFVFPEENEKLGIMRGWLEHISVRRPWRRRGLAGALIARSLAMLKGRGLDEAALAADAANLTGAVQLYEGFGFRRVRTTANYRKPIEVPVAGAFEMVPMDVVDTDLNSG